MATVKRLLGTIQCLNKRCKEVVPVKQGEGGAVSACCQYCDLSAYGKAGTQAHKDILAGMVPMVSDEPETKPAAKAVEPVKAAPVPQFLPAAKPVAKPRSTIFG